MTRATRAIAAVLFLATPHDAAAAGFAVFEQSGRGLGSAFAGEAAAAEDASTIYFNPAGMTLLEGTQLAFSGFAIIPTIHFHNERSSLNPAVGGGPLNGGNGGNAGDLGLIPTFFISHALGSRFRVGLGASTPFGLATDYERGWVGRYHALSSSLQTVNVNPSVAVRLTDWLSIGGGADVEYAKARLTNALDLGSICEIFGAQQGFPASVCPALGLPPQSVDGWVKVSGDNWNAGYNLGVLVSPWRGLRVGVAYRSTIHHDLSGQANFQIPRKAAILQKVSGALVDTGAHAAVDLPERVGLSAFQELSPRWALLTDITWTRWSLFDQIVFRFDNPKQPAIVQPEGWKDSFRYSIGIRWQPLRTVSVRAGWAYDETPVRDQTLRTPRVPDSDRVWLAGGIGWRPMNRVRLDLGYAHLFALDAPIQNRDPVTGDILRGDYSADADIVGLQATLGLF